MPGVWINTHRTSLTNIGPSLMRRGPLVREDIPAGPLINSDLNGLTRAVAVLGTAIRSVGGAVQRTTAASEFANGVFDSLERSTASAGAGGSGARCAPQSGIGFELKAVSDEALSFAASLGPLADFLTHLGHGRFG